MADNTRKYKLLMIDDEDNFRRSVSSVMQGHGIETIEASRGDRALKIAARENPDIVILDLNLRGEQGIDILRRLRETNINLPVIILTGHCGFDSALAGLNLNIVDFIQKPVDPDRLSLKIRHLLDGDSKPALKEKRISDIMVSPDAYPKLHLGDPVAKALQALKMAFFETVEEGQTTGQVRSALVYDRQNKFYGMIRFNDLLRLLVPPSLRNSHFTGFFDGMFLAQCKLFGRQSVSDLVGERVFVDIDTPLMEAVYLMAKHNLINLPVMENEELIGILRGRDIILELANNPGSI